MREKLSKELLSDTVEGRFKFRDSQEMNAFIKFLGDSFVRRERTKFRDGELHTKIIIRLLQEKPSSDIA